MRNALAASILAATGALCLATSANAGTLVDDSLSWDGLTRTFTYFEPSSMTTNKPLVIVLHGGNGTAEDAMDNYDGRWNDAAEANKFWVVYPEGEPETRNWNDCRAASTTPGDGGYDPVNGDMSEEDDVGFLVELVDWFESNHDIDTSKVYVLGASNGGFMTQRLAMEATGTFAGFAPIISGLAEKNECAAPNTGTLQSGGRKMVLLYGQSDQYVPPAGGCIATPIYGDCRQGEVDTITNTINQWKSWFGVTSSGSETAQANPVSGDNSRQYWTNHSRSGSVVLRTIRVNGAGHSVPGDTQLGWIARVLLQLGWRNLDINHVRTVGQFFGLCTVNANCY
ncbi:MAG: prolyl oligopeptidase family serine peptidase [Alphaproteobacteria bacterium]|nr:prolyl oligopeptidase family serine peptidase [Alphaproteobacteria bacterium]